MKHQRIINALAGEPWAIQQDKMTAVCEIIASRIVMGNDVNAQFTPAQDRKIASQEGSLGVIPIRGVVGNRMNMMNDSSGGMSCELVAKQFRAMVNNRDIKTIILDIDSPGGTISGVPELYSTIMEARGTKPIIAHVNSLAASAAYWIASAADEIVVTPSGMTGSIGVYTLHEDISQHLENEGIKETFIYEGENKVEGNPFEPLTDEAKEFLQARVKDSYDMFVSDVAKGRGVDVKTVLDKFGQGRAFNAKESVSRGLADRIGTFEATLTRFGVSADGRKADSLEPSIRGLDTIKRRAKLIEIQNA